MRSSLWSSEAVAPLTDKEQHNNSASTGSGIISAEAKATANNTPADWVSAACDAEAPLRLKLILQSSSDSAPRQEHILLKTRSQQRLRQV